MGVDKVLVAALDKEPDFRFGSAVAQEDAAFAAERGFDIGEQLLDIRQRFQERFFADAEVALGLREFFQQAWRKN